MTIAEFQTRIEELFGAFFTEMKRERFILAEKGEERLWMILYKAEDQKGFPLEKASFFVLENGWVWNKDDKKLLDENEIFVGSLIPADGLPLPLLSMEASVHVGKYDHLNVDLFPLSKNEQYREVFCDPVRALRAKNADLPGVLQGTVNPSLFGGYTSGGMLSGDIPTAYRSRSMPWWFEYAELYKDFLMNREKMAILKDPEVIEEGQKIKNVFLTNFRKETPRILMDIPNLYSKEKGEQLGEYLFG
jgi:hypothetical protein